MVSNKDVEWVLPFEPTVSTGEAHARAKYHAIRKSNWMSMCNQYSVDTRDFEIIEVSEEEARNSNGLCKKCLKKVDWR